MSEMDTEAAAIVATSTGTSNDTPVEADSTGGGSGDDTANDMTMTLSRSSSPVTDNSGNDNSINDNSVVEQDSAIQMSEVSHSDDANHTSEAEIAAAQNMEEKAAKEMEEDMSVCLDDSLSVNELDEMSPMERERLLMDDDDEDDLSPRQVVGGPQQGEQEEGENGQEVVAVAERGKDRGEGGEAETGGDHVDDPGDEEAQEEEEEEEEEKEEEGGHVTPEGGDGEVKGPAVTNGTIEETHSPEEIGELILNVLKRKLACSRSARRRKVLLDATLILFGKDENDQEENAMLAGAAGDGARTEERNLPREKMESETREDAKLIAELRRQLDRARTEKEELKEELTFIRKRQNENNNGDLKRKMSSVFDPTAITLASLGGGGAVADSNGGEKYVSASATAVSTSVDTPDTAAGVSAPLSALTPLPVATPFAPTATAAFPRMCNPCVMIIHNERQLKSHLKAEFHLRQVKMAEMQQQQQHRK